jgi:PAS domain S-box-containing protein
MSEDHTARTEQAEKTRKRANERLMELSMDILCSMDADGSFLSMNPASEAILGYRPEQLIGERFDMLVPPSDRQWTNEELRALIAGGHKVSDGFCARLRHCDGHLVTLSWTVEWSDADQVLFCVGRDMTAQLVAETLMCEREQFFSLSPDMFCIVDINGNFFELNRAFIDTLGYTHEELLGTAYMQLIHKDDRTRLQDAVKALTIGNSFSDLDIRAVGKDNTARCLELSAALSSDDLIYVAARDVTQIRRLAERQNRIFESITDAFITLDREWRFTYVNKRSEELLRENRHDLLGQTFWRMFPEAAGTEFDRQYRLALDTGQSVFFEAYYAPLDDWFEVSAYPSEEGLAIYYRSIKDRKLAEQKLDHAMAELERSNRDLQDFASVASHDLQEPLRKIQAFSDRLLTRSRGFDEQEQDYLRRMQSAAGRMQSLIQDLLAYSRVATRTWTMVQCDTNAVFAGVLQDMETAISRENADIDIGSLPPVMGDPSQLRQVFQNLLSNAIKFHRPDQPPEVLIYAEDSTDTGWTLVISDRGVGFEPRYADQLFQPFRRLHHRTFTGTGIGLAIVKKILERHNATITVKSEVNQGTTFRIHFPTSNQIRGNSND